MKNINEKDLQLITSDMEYSGDPAGDTSWLIISDEKTYEVAQDMKKVISEKISEITEYFKPRKQRAAAVHKDWCAAEKEALKPYEKEKGSLQGRQNAYLAIKDKERREAEEAIRAKAPAEAAVYIPEPPKQKGTRTTYSGDITNTGLFVSYLLKNGLCDVYISSFSKSALNSLAETTVKSKAIIPGFEGKKVVSAI